MIKELKLTNWKSFEKATLYLDPITVLIGLNASGKSNLLDALKFLQNTTHLAINEALSGNWLNNNIRGGISNSVFWGKDSLAFELKLSSATADVDYVYSFEVKFVTPTTPNIFRESLKKCGRTEETVLFETKPPVSADYLTVDIQGVEKSVTFNNSKTVLSQLQNTMYDSAARHESYMVFTTISNIFVLDIIPEHARAYASKSPNLSQDGANMAGVIASLPELEKARIEKIITDYTAKLPEKELKQIEVGLYGVAGDDAIWVCEEEFAKGKTQKVDARSLSDGTLRFLAILTAVLTRPKDSLLAIEEFDNGIHPSRAKMFIEMLRTEGAKRGVDIMVTTHNAEFLNEMGPQMMPFIVLAHRDANSGASRLIQIEDIPHLNKLLSKGLVGDWIAKGFLEKEL